MNRIKIFLIVAAILLVVTAFFVKTFILDNNFYYAGTLEATKVDLAARLPAAINEITVYEGDHVKEGQVLITLVCEDYKIAAKLDQENYNRNKQLLENNVISQSDFDVYRTQMEDANTKVNWCTIVSPINGVVLSRYHEPGEWMTQGTKILTLANIRDIWAYIYVPQPLVAKLFLGMKLKGHLPELKGKEFYGKIIKISDEAEFTPKNVQTQNERERLIYGVKVSFIESNADEILKPGMTIEIVLPK